MTRCYDDWFPLAHHVLAEELDQPTKEQKMGKTTDDEGGIVRCECGRAVPCRHCPTTPIDPADIRPGDMVRMVDEFIVERSTRDYITSTGRAHRIYRQRTTEQGTTRTWHLVSRPDPHAEAVEALRDASWSVRNDGSGHDPLPGLPEAAELFHHLGLNGWDVVRRAES